MQRHLLTTLLIMLTGLATTGQAEEIASFGAAFPANVPLQQTAGGSFTVTGNVAGTEAEFLVDTGASMVTVSRDLFTRIKGQSGVRPAGEVAARTASGKLELLKVYEVESFRLGDSCELGPQKIAVLTRGGRNLLGMSALSQVAPFAVFTSPPALGLSRCESAPNLAGR